LGKCPTCNAWSSFVEEGPEPSKASRKRTPSKVVRIDSAAVALADVDAGGEASRIATGQNELDRVLGGGLVPGSTVLIGGDPGIGKSTLALQLASGVASARRPVLYVAGEEAAAQISLRAERLNVAADRIFVLSATDTEAVIAAVAKHQPAVVIVDSIQTIHTDRIESAPGSVAQLREAGAELVMSGREHSAAMVMIGHVTKEGYLAGPRVLEHMVDTVLYFEGDKNYVFRILRAVKNRFGPAGEIGIFEMRSTGLAEVDNPSEAFTGAHRNTAAGSVVTAAIEGSRALLVEVQALAAPSNPGNARRTTLGVDHGRVAMLAAVMERRLGLSMVSHDLFVNTVGGVRVDDPGVDLAVIAALASSFVDKPLPSELVVIGEVGLTGEVRAVSQPQARIQEAVRLGFTHLVVPQVIADQAKKAGAKVVTGVTTIEQAWQAL
jgi:DNA repair protein RadA/Sms